MHSSEQTSKADNPAREIYLDEILLSSTSTPLPLGTSESIASSSSQSDQPGPHRRRWLIPLVCFLATCVTTFYAGFIGWNINDAFRFEQHNWQNQAAIWRGVYFMSALIGILLAHEMGHFLMTVRHRIAASLPIFIPFPQPMTGTMGAVISMDGSSATRRQLFDIGIAGPLAGLVVIVPVLILGVRNTPEQYINQPAPLTQPAAAHPLWPQHRQPRATQPQKTVATENTTTANQPKPAKPNGAGKENVEVPHEINNVILARPLGRPLLVEWLVQWLRPSLPLNLVNPWLMAGWVGCLITGLNMIPLSQLDGGHVTYCLFGRKAHTLAKAVLITAIAAMIITDVYIWAPMLILVTFLGIFHPRTANDREPLGRFRTALGLLSLSIPVICFITRPFM